MKSNILAFFLSIGSIGLAVLIIWFYNMSDKDAPEIRFTAMDLIYDSSTTEADLLGGVMAYDAVDGDITDRIVVEKSIIDDEQGTAVVYYAVSDLSGNVTKMSRVFPADIENIKGASDEETIDSEGLYPSGFTTETAEGQEITEGDGIAGEGGETLSGGEGAVTQGESGNSSDSSEGNSDNN